MAVKCELMKSVKDRSWKIPGNFYCTFYFMLSDLLFIHYFQNYLLQNLLIKLKSKQKRQEGTFLSKGHHIALIFNAKQE